MGAPRNIVLIIADSLRWDTLHASGDHRLPYTMGHGVCFQQARSGGCWTLPATASMFTGLMPHEHGATAQTRNIYRHVPTLAERMAAQGYCPHMITANVVTTDIFGLHRGFQTLDRIWQQETIRYKNLFDLLTVLSKPRLRKKFFSKDLIMGRLNGDFQAAGVWLQSTAEAIFEHARQILQDSTRREQRTFLFLNLMETHFPYHVHEHFRTSATALWDKMREMYSLYHLVNQTRLIHDKEYIAPDMLQLLRQRQRQAWERLAPRVDAFVQELRERYDATVVFGSDHGDNFGEQGWQYHFSNVNDAGNRVPLFWVHHDRDEVREEPTAVSARDLFGALLKTAGDPDPELFSCLEHPERSLPLLESYWYNNRGRTLPRFRYNQFAFIAGEQRFVHRAQQWYSAPVMQLDEPEPAFQPLGAAINPLYEEVDNPERLAAIQQAFAAYCDFTERLPLAAAAAAVGGHDYPVDVASSGHSQ